MSIGVGLVALGDTTGNPVLRGVDIRGDANKMEDWAKVRTACFRGARGVRGVHGGKFT